MRHCVVRHPFPSGQTANRSVPVFGVFTQTLFVSSQLSSVHLFESLQDLGEVTQVPASTPLVAQAWVKQNVSAWQVVATW